MNPEVVWAPGKRPAQIAAYMRQAAAADRTVVAVRVEDDVAATITREIPEAIYNQRACTLRYRTFCHTPATNLGLQGGNQIAIGAGILVFAPNETRGRIISHHENGCTRHAG